MEDAQVGWIAAIIIGGIAGSLAEQFMKSEMGILMNIVLGIVGAAVFRSMAFLPEAGQFAPELSRELVDEQVVSEENIPQPVQHALF